jgi:hypothetical protein
MKVGQLTQQQAAILSGEMYSQDAFFYPIQDANDNWVISIEEINGCTNEVFSWVKELQLIEYEPKQETY